jgi:type VI secretion system protein ImpB
MKESTQHKLDRVRPPRVQITYDLELAGATKRTELPLVMGIMADLTGDRADEAAFPTLKQRKFVEIDRDNLDKVLYRSRPRVAGIRVPGVEGPVDLEFRTMDDFEPMSIVRRVPEMAKLLRQRQRLSDLLAKLDGNDALEAQLRAVIADDARLTELKQLAAPAVEEEEKQASEQEEKASRRLQDELEA